MPVRRLAAGNRVKSPQVSREIRDRREHLIGRGAIGVKLGSSDSLVTSCEAPGPERRDAGDTLRSDARSFQEHPPAGTG
jgi:hypothetical protein